MCTMSFLIFNEKLKNFQLFHMQKFKVSKRNEEKEEKITIDHCLQRGGVHVIPTPMSLPTVAK